MKKMMKNLALSGTALLALSFAGQSFAAAAPFSDVANSTAKNKIVSLYDKGVINGVGNGQFKPNASMTAAQGIQLIVKALDLNLDLVRFIKEPKATDYFANANNDAWYANTLITAAVNNMDLPADLDPNKVWTREEFTHQLILAMESHSNLPMIKIIPVEIADVSEFTNGYDGSIQRALVLGIAKLDSKGNFKPAGPITRADAAEMTYNALEYIKAHPAPSATE
ncbi:S-layer homology domain-containing protein [Paenibacillus sp. sgz500958]|uniref:S-layer homology domain-containing protein n=1 Tax=Paenibacillus sp. sgz500958 TaxID=3242475 RepID=UPI0036D37CC7